MCLAHAAKVPLRLFDTSGDLAVPWFGPVALTHPLRLDNASTSIDSAKPTLVLRGGLERGTGVHFVHLG